MGARSTVADPPPAEYDETRKPRPGSGGQRVCDCYWPRCQRCSEHVPLHISDFCMGRDEVAVFCHRHLPRRNVVVYELASEAFQPSYGRGDDFYHNPPKGWRMGVRYKTRPPRDYGLQAAEPNIGAAYLAEYRNRNGRSAFFTDDVPALHRTERAAVRAALRDVAQRRERWGDDASLRPWLDADERVWRAREARIELRASLDGLLAEVPLLRDLRESRRLSAVVLIGSLASRDSVPGLSDVDLYVLARRFKPGLKLAWLEAREVEVNLVCRNPRFARRSLREGNPVDLVALRYGEVLWDDGTFAALRRGSKRCGVTAATRESWMTTSAHWLSRAVENYFNPTCESDFFAGLFHAARDLLRAHLIGHGGGLVEGWEVEAAAQERWPDLAEHYGRIRHARAAWDTFEFPLFQDRTRIEGELGRLLLSLEAIARPVYRASGLRLPSLESLLHQLFDRRGARSLHSVHLHPEDATMLITYVARDGKLRITRRRL